MEGDTLQYKILMKEQLRFSFFFFTIDQTVVIDCIQVKEKQRESENVFQDRSSTSYKKMNVSKQRSKSSSLKCSMK